MTLPNALVIGPMKAGTTWIHDYFAARGDISLPGETKETFFFDRYFDRGPEWYTGLFDQDRATGYRIEVAPSIFHHGAAPDRVRQTLGDIPLIITRREPVARSLSHYQHLKRYGYTNASLRTACEAFPQIITASCYAAQAERWRRSLPGSPVLELDMEDLASSPSDYTRQLCTFLDIPFVDPATLSIEKANAAAVPPSFHLAKMGRLTAWTLRRMGLYSVVNAAKSAGLKALFFGQPGATPVRPEVSREDLDWLRDRISCTDRSGGLDNFQ